jgi:hypothetical protein
MYTHKPEQIKGDGAGLVLEVKIPVVCFLVFADMHMISSIQTHFMTAITSHCETVNDNEKNLNIYKTNFMFVEPCIVR